MKQEFQNEINEFTERNRVSRHRLAREAEIDPAVIYRFLEDGTNITIETIEKLRSAMDRLRIVG